jgi:hypothetical protein
LSFLQENLSKIYIMIECTECQTVYHSIILLKNAGYSVHFDCFVCIPLNILLSIKNFPVIETATDQSYQFVSEIEISKKTKLLVCSSNKLFTFAPNMYIIKL